MSLLTQFYKDMQAWVEAGLPAVNPHGFRTYRGLCVNLDRWALKPEISEDESYALEKELENQFKSAGLDEWYPFNDGSSGYFLEECDRHTLYQNPKRLDCIKNHAVSQQPE